MMRFTFVFILFAILISNSGCALFHKDAPNRWRPAAVSGQLVPDGNTPAPNDHVFVDYRQVEVEGRTGARPLRSGQSVSTGDIVKVEVEKTVRRLVFGDGHLFDIDIEKREFDYDVLVGPPFGSGDDVVFTFHNTEPVIELNSPGWVIAWGKFPIIQTKYVRIGGTSATWGGDSADAKFVVGLDSANKVFILLADSTHTEPISVICENDGRTIATVSADVGFAGGVTVDSACNTGPAPANAPALVNEVIAVARTTGVGYP